MAVDTDYVLAAACEADAVVCIDRSPGESLVAGTPVGRFWSAGETALDDEATDTLRRCVSVALRVGPERTVAQDVGFGLR